MFGPWFVIQYFVSFKFCNPLDWEERAGYFTFIVFLMSCYCYCYVALPHGAVGWYAVCDFGISCSYLLAFVSLSEGSIHLKAVTVLVERLRESHYSTCCETRAKSVAV